MHVYYNLNLKPFIIMYLKKIHDDFSQEKNDKEITQDSQNLL